MPDVVNALKFQRKLASVESKYIQEIQRRRKELRRALLEITVRDGVSRNAVAAMSREIAALTTQLTAVGREAGQEIQLITQNYTRKQIKVLRSVGLAQQATPENVISSGNVMAQDAQASYLTNTSAWLSGLQTSIQTQAAKLRLSQATPEEIQARLLSEDLADGRASVWLANESAAKQEETNNIWLAGVGLVAGYMMLFNEQEPDGVQYKKQAIATIDERTTDCCLRVHGQIQDLDDPFILTGTPRYADEIQDPPFHWYCRTSETLYHEELEQIGTPTSEMVDAAKAELDAREKTGTRTPIYPSHATARRVR